MDVSVTQFRRELFEIMGKVLAGDKLERIQSTAIRVLSTWAIQDLTHLHQISRVLALQSS